MNKDAKILTIDLFGQAHECFYQLGLRDKEEAKIVIDHICSLISLPNEMASKLVEKSVKEMLALLNTGGDEFNTYISAYAEGLNLPKKEVAYCLLIPELMCFMAKWIPGIPTALLGCSSFFTKYNDGSIGHVRILDFPLQGSYDKRERLLRTRFENMPAMLSFGTSGLPFPALTTKTQDGITLAIHQKFSDVFNHKGASIFQIVFQLLATAKNPHEAIEFCKNNPSITSWNINMAFPTGEVLELDLLGNDIEYQIHHLNVDEILYINNSLKHSTKRSSKLPLNIEAYNDLRKKSAHRKINHYSKKKNKNDLEFIKMVTTLHYGKDEKIILDPLTPSSVSVVAMNTHRDSIYTIPHKAPKIFTGEILEIKNGFSRNCEQITHRSKTPSYPKHLVRGHHSFMESQVAFDKKDFHKSYHHIQMAMEDFKGTTLRPIAIFYFLVLQFIFDKHKKIRKELIVDFKNLIPELPDHLADHARLFIFRLEKLLDLPSSISENEFSNSDMAKIMEVEKELSNLFFHAFIAKTMNIRIDLLDIIYPHIRLIS